MQDASNKEYDYDYRTLASSAVLTTLSIGVPSGRLLDRETSQKIAEEAKATHGVLNAYKNIYSDSKELKAISDYSQKVRQRHRAISLPFGDGGMRLLPEARRAAHSELMSDSLVEWGKLKDKFEEKLPDLHDVDKAKAIMGDLYDATNYKAISEVMQKFSFNWNYLPVPDSGHFIIDNANAAAGDLIDRFEMHSKNSVNMAMKEAWDMLKRELRRVSNNCRTKEQRDDGKTSRFGPQNYENALDLVETLSSYNIVNDPNLEQAREEFEEILNDTNDVKIKNSDTEKEKVKDGVDSILEKFGL